MAAIWMLVTTDEFELPLVVADSAGELARILGTVPDSIYSNVHHCRAAGYRCKYVKVEVEDEE